MRMVGPEASAESQTCNLELSGYDEFDVERRSSSSETNDVASRFSIHATDDVASMSMTE